MSAALVPRPRAHLTRYHGVFAPNFKHRRSIVPNPAHQTAREPHATRPASMSWMQRLKRVFRIDCSDAPKVPGAACLTAVSDWSRHSDAGMDMNSVMASEGTVTELPFRNLHVQPASLTDSGSPPMWTIQSS